LARHREQNSHPRSRVCGEEKSTSLSANSECFCYDERERKEPPWGCFLFLCGPNCLNDDGNWRTHVMRRAKRRRNFGAPSSCRFIFRPPKGRAAHSQLGWLEAARNLGSAPRPASQFICVAQEEKNVTSPLSVPVSAYLLYSHHSYLCAAR
jgi:hypothetical protein